MQNTIFRTYTYNGYKITFKKSEFVMVVSSELAAPFGKRHTDWLNTKSTKGFISELSIIRNIAISDLMTVITGYKGKLWVHEDIALRYAQWLSSDLAKWCKSRFEELSNIEAPNIIESVMEEWREIPGFSGRYYVSDLGRVKQMAGSAGQWGNHYSIKESILKSRFDTNGYVTVVLKDDNNKTHTQLVHRLIALAFIPNPNNYPCINHKNEDKRDNRIENLEWCTYKYNANYGTCKQRNSIKQGRPIIGVNIETGEKLWFHSLNEARRHGYEPNVGAKLTKRSLDSIRKSSKIIWHWADDESFKMPIL